MRHKFLWLSSSFLFVLLCLWSLSCNKNGQVTNPNNGGTDLLENATDYTGSYPAPEKITYLNRGVSTDVTAYPGQIIVFFNMPISDTEASQIININGGTIIEKIPAIGYYFISDSLDRINAFISAMQADSMVIFVSPNIVGSLSSGVAILDGCLLSHGADVKATLENNGGTSGGCVDIVTTKTDVAMSKVIKEILTEGNQNKTGTTLINLSAAGGLNGKDWASQLPLDQVQAQNDWIRFMRGILFTIAALPPEYRENLVLTMAAGNGNMPITDLMAQLRSNPRIANVLENNVLIVSTTLMKGNYSTTDYDVAIRDNPQAAWGTSFAAPGAMAIVQNIMRLTGASAKVALKAVKEAVAANANHKLLQTEAIDQANAIGNSCTYKTSSPGQNFNSSGGNGTVTVTTGNGCSWTAVSSSPSWITVTSGSSGSGTGTVTYSLSANTSTVMREAVISIEDSDFVIIQAGASSGTTGKFDGTWEGTYDEIFYYVSGSTWNDTGTVSLVIKNNVITCDMPFYGSTGSVDDAGNGTWHVDTTIVFTGTFSTGGSASGTWTYNLPGTGHGTGTWTAQKQ